jgi:hypothetical protein
MSRFPENDEAEKYNESGSAAQASSCHLPAFRNAFSAGSRTFLAVIVIMRSALFRTPGADVGA